MPPLPPLEPVLLGVVVPALCSGAVLLAAWWPRARDGAVAGGRWGGAVAFGGGCALAHALTFGGWPSRPIDVADWLPWLALAAAAVGLCDPWLGRGQWWRALLRLALCTAALWLLARPYIGRDWALPFAIAWLAVLSMTTFCGWTSLDALARRTHGPAVPLAVAVTCAAGSAALLMGGVASLAQLAGAIVAMCAGALVVALLNRRMTLAGGGAAVLATVPAYLWLDGVLYATEPVALASAFLLIAAPSGAWIGDTPFLRGLSPGPRLTARLGAVAFLAGAAVAIASAAP